MPGIPLGIRDDPARHTKYRSDIQGLRAVAVISVVAYHSGMSFPGGFVGVDMFFVISGYVISRLIANEVLSDVGFSMRRFMVRRIKRLLPILFVVVTATIVLLTRFFSSFGEVQQATGTARWASGFAANIGLFLDDTYIALVDNPFRHLWSLAVEEQFYLVFPVLFVLYLRADQRSIRSSDIARRLLIAVSIASFALCVALSMSTSVTLQKFSFFSTPTRMWQFLIGVSVTLLERSVHIAPSWRLRFLSIASLLGIGWSLFALREWTNFPGLWAVVPTIATAGLIMSSVSGSFLNSALSVRPLILVGDVSYGWYLWHWPIIVIVRRQFGSGAIPSLSAVLGSLALSSISYVLIENPLRRRILGMRIAVALALSTSVLLFTVSSIVARTADETQARALSPQVSAESVRVVNGLAPRDTLLTSRKACHETDRTVEEIVQECSNSIGGTKPSVLLIGDSHAGAVSDGLLAAGEEMELKVTGFFGFGCPIADGFNATTKGICESYVPYSMNLAQQLKPDVVVIAHTYVTYLTGEQPADVVYPTVTSGQIPADLSDKSVTLVRALRERVIELSKLKMKVIVLAEVPFAVMPDTRTEQEMWAHNRIREIVTGDITTRLENVDGVTIVDASHALCGVSPTCAVDRDGRLQYWHKTHLNRHGSLRLTAFWIDALNDALSK